MLKEILVYRIKRRGRRKKYNAKSSIAEAISLSLKLVGMYNGAMPKKYLQKQPPDIFYKEFFAKFAEKCLRCSLSLIQLQAQGLQLLCHRYF